MLVDQSYTQILLHENVEDKGGQWVKKRDFRPDFFFVILGMDRQVIKGSYVHFQHGIALTTQSFENQNITETIVVRKLSHCYFTRSNPKRICLSNFAFQCF